MVIPEPPGSGNPSDLIVWGLVVVVLALLGSLTFIIKTYRKTDALTQDVEVRQEAQHDFSAKIETIEEAIDKLLAAHEAFAKQGWASLPHDLDSSAGLTEVIREIQMQLRFLIERTERIDQKIEIHFAQHDSDKKRR